MYAQQFLETGCINRWLLYNKLPQLSHHLTMFSSISCYLQGLQTLLYPVFFRVLSLITTTNFAVKAAYTNELVSCWVLCMMNMWFSYTFAIYNCLFISITFSCHISLFRCMIDRTIFRDTSNCLISSILWTVDCKSWWLVTIVHTAGCTI